MTYRFGLFEFDTASHELLKGGRPVALEPQPARALALLLSRAGALVGREELKHVVWGEGTHVDFDRGLAMSNTSFSASCSGPTPGSASSRT